MIKWTIERLRRNRLPFTIPVIALSVCAAILLAVPVAPVAVSARNLTTDDVSGRAGHRVTTDLGFDEVRDLKVSASDNRLVLSGEDSVRVFALDTMSLIAEHTSIHGAGELQMHSSSVFVVGSTDGIVTEIHLETGAVLNQWALDVPALTSIAVSDEFVWFTYGFGAWDAGVGRVGRSGGLVETIEIVETVRADAIIRVTPVRPNEFYIGYRHISPMSIGRYSVDGVVATQVAKTPHGATGGGLNAFEVSLDGERIWATSGSPYHLVELTGETLEVVPISYDGTDHLYNVAIEPTSNELLVAATKSHTDVVWLLDRDVPAARNRIELRGSLQALAVTSSQLFAVESRGYGAILHTWALDYVRSPNTIEIFVNGHGDGPRQSGRFRLRCGGFEHIFSIVYGQSTTVTVPADEAVCLLFDISHSAPLVLLGSRFERSDQWEFSEHSPLVFDPEERSFIGIFDIFPSPAFNTERLVAQTFVDLLGRQATNQEQIGWTQAIENGLATRAGFVIGMMDDAAGYEQLRAPVARLYRAFFLRNSDAPGISYWVSVQRSGTPITAISQFFATSPEFDRRYGKLTNAQFVELVYANVLDRIPDGAGYDYWLNQMGEGLSRGDLMFYFSNSPEYRASTNAEAFALYVVRTLELREPPAQDLLVLAAIYEEEGREAVVEFVLDALPYFERFWIDNTNPEGLVAGLSVDRISTCACEGLQVAAEAWLRQRS